MPGKNRRGGKAPRESQLTGRRAPIALEQLKSLLFGRDQHRPLELTADHIQSILAVRRARHCVFGKGLFSDPAWDMLLELYAAKLEGRSVSLSELALSIEVPQSTTARWIVAVETRGLVSTASDPNDPIDLKLQLTGKAAAALKELADHWGAAFRSI